MTSITATNNTTATATADAAKPTINADFTMFVKLLTAQMQNQDPLDPMDTSQYTQQLVQYSQVEQSMAQTTTLKSMLSAMSTSDLTQASSLIGRQVSVESATAALGETPAQWNWQASREVSELTATITNSKGHVIEKRTLDPNASGEFSWDGTLSGGGKAPEGSYTIAFAGADTEGNSVPVSVTTRGKVTEISMENGAVMIAVNGNRSAISSLRNVALD